MTTRRRGALLLFVALAAAVFAVRGPVRLATRSDHTTDFVGPYLGTRAWVRGLNPYSPETFWTMAEEVGWGSDDRPDGFPSRTPYPPTTFVLLSPLAPLPWSVARLAAIVVPSALALFAMLALSRTEDVRDTPASRGAFLGLALLLGPIHTGIGTGNPAAPAVALIAIGVWAALERRAVAAGVCLALAGCLKPLVPLFALGYLMLRADWRPVRAAVATAVLVAAVGTGWLAVAGTPWWSDYLRNNGMFFDDYGGAIVKWSDGHMQFVHLQYLGYRLFGDTLSASVFSGGVVLIFLAAWAWLFWRAPSGYLLLDLSILAVISLLPIYHRIYDAGVLLLPLAWAVAAFRRGAARHARLVLLLMAPFLLPSVTLLEMPTVAGRVPEWLSSGWWWARLVEPHQVWALVLMTMVLLAARASTPQSVSPASAR